MAGLFLMATKGHRVQQEVKSSPESFLFPLSLSSFSPPVPDERERGKRKISGRVDIISCCTQGHKKHKTITPSCASCASLWPLKWFDFSHRK
jgi:hypothetical protein